jgi:hypothetical protein
MYYNSSAKQHRQTKYFWQKSYQYGMLICKKCKSWKQTSCAVAFFATTNKNSCDNCKNQKYGHKKTTRGGVV